MGMGRLTRWVLIAATSLLALGSAAHAAIPTPQLKPANPAAAERVLKGAQYTDFKRALTAGIDRDWTTHARMQARVTDSLAQNVLAWQRAAYDSNAPFEQVTHVVRNLGDWPRMITIQAKGERELLERGAPAREVDEWFGDREPVSGEGRIVLGRALIARGERQRGEDYIRKGWREARLTRDVQRDVFRTHRDLLNADDHAARVDHLIWLGTRHFDKARALLPHMPAGERALADARMTLAQRRPGVTAKVRAVPAALQSSPELQYERARWRRKKTSKDESVEQLLAMDAPVASEAGRIAVWREKKIAIYWLLGEKRFRDAYALTQHTGLTEGLAFQEAEFLAGWLALRRLDDAARAETHFRTLYDGVSRSISKARGAYWLARALEAQGRTTAANAMFEVAAGFPNTFYGQLAHTETGAGRDFSLPPDPREVLPTDVRVRALRLLGEAGEENLVQVFSYHLDDELGTIEELAGLSRYGWEIDARRASVRAAKQAARFGTLLPELGYPVPASVTALDANTFDIPFTLAIARQESEFAPNATSSAKAYGMMQMIDATARATARKHGLRYDRTRMLSDEFYAARMGSLHLNDLLARYDGSYILSAIAYNAGPTRVRQWTELYGDPRTGEIDPVDFLESIPFSETRNYVQRVMENMQVYRARLNNNAAPNLTAQSIRTGAR